MRRNTTVDDATLDDYNILEQQLLPHGQQEVHHGQQEEDPWIIGQQYYGEEAAKYDVNNVNLNDYEIRQATA
eukprot:2171169-Amphidinium_carterae.1